MVQSGVLLFFEGLFVVLYLVGAVGLVMIILFPWLFISEKKKIKNHLSKEKDDDDEGTGRTVFN